MAEKLNTPDGMQYIFQKNGGLGAYMETDRCIVRSICEEDLSTYQALYHDEAAIALFGDGKPRTSIQTAETVHKMILRWKNSDPFSSLTVELKGEDEVIGTVVIGHGCAEGEADIAGLGFGKFQKQRFGTEIATALFTNYIPELKRFEVNQGEDSIPPAPLRVIHATARTDNILSSKLLTNMGFQTAGEPALLWQAERRHYYLYI